MSEEAYWEPKKESNYYSVLRLNSGASGITALRALFPTGEADHMNLVLFSTSGIHGSYTTIEAAEQALHNEENLLSVTFLVLQPRIVTMRYGNCTPETVEDVQFLKRLRETSMKEIAGIGV